MSDMVTCDILQMPDGIACGLCLGEGLPEWICPQCGNTGRLQWPGDGQMVPPPMCTRCDARHMVLIGHGGDERLPVYRCENGHLTAIRYARAAGEGRADG
jgi:hypothetical protein